MVALRISYCIAWVGAVVVWCCGEDGHHENNLHLGALGDTEMMSNDAKKVEGGGVYSLRGCLAVVLCVCEYVGGGSCFREELAVTCYFCKRQLQTQPRTSHRHGILLLDDG